LAGVYFSTNRLICFPGKVNTVIPIAQIWLESYFLSNRLICFPGKVNNS